jgi:hypothetical protein
MKKVRFFVKDFQNKGPSQKTKIEITKKLRRLKIGTMAKMSPKTSKKDLFAYFWVFSILTNENRLSSLLANQNILISQN